MAAIALAYDPQPFFMHPTIRKISGKLADRFLRRCAELRRRTRLPPFVHKLKNNPADRAPETGAGAIINDIFPIALMVLRLSKFGEL